MLKSLKVFFLNNNKLHQTYNDRLLFVIIRIFSNKEFLIRKQSKMSFAQKIINGGQNESFNRSPAALSQKNYSNRLVYKRRSKTKNKIKFDCKKNACPPKIVNIGYIFSV